jgi:hypothetical protein
MRSFTTNIRQADGDNPESYLAFLFTNVKIEATRTETLIV